MTPLVLPWPDRNLHPNARPHWAVKARAAKNARHQAYMLALAAGWRKMELPATGRLRLFLDFYPRSRRRMDDDGLMASFKAFRDGIADLLGIDDSRFFTNICLHEYDSALAGQVHVRVEL